MSNQMTIFFAIKNVDDRPVATITSSHPELFLTIAESLQRVQSEVEVHLEGESVVLEHPTATFAQVFETICEEMDAETNTNLPPFTNIERTVIGKDRASFDISVDIDEVVKRMFGFA